MFQPIITIIIPIYKAENCIKRCIDSIINQTFTSFELLLINDGSPDSSGKICDEYAQTDQRIKVFHKKNGGVSSARNLGIQKSNGNFICFIDSDDWIEPYHLEALYQTYQTYHCDLIINGYAKEKKNSKTIQVHTGIYTTKEIPNGITELKRNQLLGYPWNKLFKKDIIEQYNIKFDHSITLREDEIFVLQYLTHCNSIQCTDSISYHYIELENSLSKKKHSYCSLKKAVELIKQYSIELSNRFGGTNKAFIEQIEKEYQYYNIRLISTLYNEKNSNKYIKNELYKITKNKSAIKKYYVTNNLKQRIVKALLLYIPLNILNVYFFIIFRKIWR
ncbi:glycosyltransferase family 2 protein [Phocaeicola vulgatus]|uniref:glycosyltransferase family 2 protein n=1 Tax=Phocaeicola vulgatus TaxID=821 RepID=UPI003566507C